MRASPSYSSLALLPLLLACDKTMPKTAGPAIELEPAELAFAGVEYGTQPQQLLRLRNIGRQVLTIAQMESDAKEFTAAAPGLSINPESAIDVTVTFDARRRNSAHGTLSITSDDPLHPVVTVKLTATASEESMCAIDASVHLLQFGEVNNTRHVYLTNRGRAPCTILSVQTSTSTTFHVESGRALPFEVAPATSSTVTVSWTKRGHSVRDQLTITTDDVREPTIDVELVGQSYFETHPCYQIHGPSYLLPTPIGSVSTTVLALTAFNSSECELDRIDFVSTDPTTLNLEMRSDALRIYQGSPLRLYLFFRPVVSGPASAILTLTSHDVVQSLTLSGEAYEPTLCIEPRDVHLTSSTGTISYSACAQADVLVSRVEIDSADPGISIDPLDPPSEVIARGEARDIQLAVEAAGDLAEGTMTIESDSPHGYRQVVRFTSGGELVPVEAGRYLEIDDAFSGRPHRLGLQGRHERYPLFTLDKSDFAAATSPDGRFVASIERNEGALRIVERNTGAESTVVSAIASAVSWRPDVESTPPYQLVYSDGSSLFVGSPFANKPLRTLATVREVSAPAWGALGSIAFFDQDENGWFLGLVSEDGAQRVTKPLAQQPLGQPAFSPDGRFIAFAVDGGGIEVVSAANLDARTDLSLGPLAQAPAFSLDGRYLAFVSSGDVEIVAIDPETAAPIGDPITVWTGFDPRRLAFSR